MMKYIILFTLSVVALASGGPGPMFYQFIDGCKGSASDADIAAIMTHAEKLSDAAYCVLGCAMKKSEMMTADNKINMDNVKTTFAPMQSKNPDTYQGFITIFESCQPTGSPSECEAAKIVHECTGPKMKQLIPMPGGRGPQS